LKILQFGEIQIQTKFASQDFVDKYSKHKYRNMRNIKKGNPINIYYIPVSLDKNKNCYIMEFYKEKEPE
jgi:hypothetical protein